VRPGTTIALAVLLVLILGAAFLQFVFHLEAPEGALSSRLLAILEGAPSGDLRKGRAGGAAGATPEACEPAARAAAVKTGLRQQTQTCLGRAGRLVP
jgi:hypothetical protein